MRSATIEHPVRLFSALLASLAALVLSAGLAMAEYKNAELGKEALRYEAALKQKHGKGTRQEALSIWRTAERLWRARRYADAVPLYERAVGLGLKNSDLWQQYSIVLGVAPPRRYNLALMAAYRAFDLAASDVDKAQSLYLLGFWTERLDRPKEALTIYEEALAIRSHNAAKQRYDRLIALYRHMITKTRADAEREQPRICLTFSQTLKATDPSDLAQYLVIEPQIKPAISVVGKDLCIEGVEHGTTYRVTVRPGLPSARDELKLEKAAVFNISVADREARVGFRGSAFILPRTSRQGIPFTSINVDAVDMRVLRINDRNLVRSLNNRNINDILSGYDIRKLVDTDGEEVWSGTVEVQASKNREVTTAVPMREVLKDPKPGIYIVVAAAKGTERRRYQDWATQWVVVTDLALTTYRGNDGLHVFVRSFDSAAAVAGAQVRLIARNNKVLGTAETDANGRVTFAAGLVRGQGGNQPAAVYVYRQTGEFNFLNLDRPGFDLTDRGVSGRSAPGPVDAYLYTERGIYRPGATVHLTTLIRDDRGAALNAVPLTVRLIRPDGVEARRFTIRPGDLAGGAHLKVPLSRASRTGTWRLTAHVDPKGPSVGQVSFQVEDFVPERINATLKADKPTLVPGTANTVRVDAQYLYGAPAADLAVDAEMVLMIDRAPFDAWRAYQFGLVQERWSARRLKLKSVRTDAKGQAGLVLQLDGKPETTLPLKASVRVSVIEAGGRATERVTSIPVRAASLYLGVKLDGDDARVADGTPANFSVIALDGAGKRRAASGLKYRIVRETYRYVWYFQGGRWNYRVIQRDDPVKSGTLTVAANAVAALSASMEPGRYRLEVSDAATGAASSTRFYVGWTTSLSADNVPDKLAVALDKKQYKAGDTAKISIKPPFDGMVHVVVASDRLYLSRVVQVTRAGTTLDLPVAKDWGPGVYVMATAYRPMNKQAGRGPSRAIGLAYMPLDMSAGTLTLSVAAPVKIEPRRKVEVAVKVSGAAAGEKVFVTLAAVDEGILQLTQYRSPAPSKYYFGKRRLALKIRDDYGRLIDAYAGRLGKVRVGGDAAAKFTGGLDASSIKTVSLFSGVVEVDASGTARISLDVPDFNGSLRLMATAWSKSAVGETESKMIVRDPVVSVVTLPRFLAPGDRGQVTVSLHNVDGPAGAYKLALAASGRAVAAGPNATRTVDLAKDGRLVGRFTLTGETSGVSKISLSLSGPNGFAIRREWSLAVRPAQPPVTVSKSIRLTKGKGTWLLRGQLADYLPGTARLYLSAGRTPDLGIPELLRSLDRYPYGCAEQTTSKTLPMLYLSDMARSLGLAADDTTIRSRVQASIYRVLNMQTRSGDFGLWSAYDSTGGWLTAYIMDFLSQARTRGYTVPEVAFENGLDRLERIVRTASYDPESLPVHTYALYVLAKNKRTDVSALRYVYDNYGSKLPTALAKAQLGAAFALYGDMTRAGAMMTAARDHKQRPSLEGRYWRSYVRDYGSYLRDRAGVLYLTATTQPDSGDIDGLVEEVSKLRSASKHLSTQEKAWLLMTAHGLAPKATPYTVSLTGEQPTTSGKPLYRRYTDTALRDGVLVRNTGDGTLWVGTTVVGIPKKDLPAEKSGFEITRAFYTLDGKRADLTKVRQSDVLVALIRVSATSKLYHQALIVDLLPAGFEIENPRLGARDAGKMKWLPKLATARNIEPRDDRYVAAMDIGGKGRDFYLAYVVRAVTPGTFRLPAAFVEDMYSPNYRGRDEMSSVTVLPRS